MLSSASARARFTAWNSAHRILVYDADSQSLNEGGNLLGLMRSSAKRGSKVKSAGSREAFMRSGENPKSSSIGSRSVLHIGNIATDGSIKYGVPPRIELIHRFFATTPVKNDNHDPRGEDPTFVSSGSEQYAYAGRSIRRACTTAPQFHAGPAAAYHKSLAMQFYKIELGEQRRLMGVMEHHSKESSVGGLAMTKDGGKGVGLTERSATYAGSGASTENEGLGGVNMSGSKSEASAAISAVVKAGMFPFSITAGVEKGAKNRYRNIWPFEHARVRLSKARPEDDDYMNASYVQPLGTTKRYIATQGPLPATFTDFWTLCWEQNVHVIVMLTREVESSLVKCGNYWNEGTYGPLKLKLATATKIPSSQKPKGKHRSSPPKGEQPSDAGVIRRVFELTHSGYPDAPPRVMTQLQYLEWPDLDVPKDPRGLLKLMREVDDVVEETRGSGERVWGEGPLSNSPRRRHLGSAYRTSPAEPSNRKGETGGFIAEDVEVDPVTGIAPHARSNPPVLLHCSAGVGRTGGFIAVDAILDAVRREMRMRKESNTGRSDSPGDASASASARGSGSRSPSDDPMEVDSRASASPSLRPREIAVAPAPAVAVTAAREGGGGEDVGLTMPVSVGGNEVHVPVAGFSSPIPRADGRRRWRRQWATGGEAEDGDEAFE
ncbi:hypothetical protein EW026_g7754 [Hermanssonia centrifuga]|uniref:Uncharacterized protein n=1 Tax=Hermanssonia centrifuga TaxID=98765 RepID=A0A4S4K6R6_9APHY|nr:hypothetical protein EW026_g7754 [Hermanssonia centrifuga]